MIGEEVWVKDRWWRGECEGKDCGELLVEVSGFVDGGM